ncbi:MAG: serine/threonine-protein kinase [Candidatus Margulisiibacteriota bacterium]
MAPRKSFSDYDMIGPIQRGGMSIVYKAEEIATSQAQILKIARNFIKREYYQHIKSEAKSGSLLCMEPEAELDPFQLKTEVELNLVEYLASEAKILSGNIHPMFPRFYGFINEGGWYAIAMEYIGGETLSNLIGNRVKIPLHMAIGIIKETCTGLKALHESGLVHRDITPGNIIVSKYLGVFDPTVRIIDLGICCGINHKQKGPFGIGTPKYIAPEQERNEEVDERTDIFTLGLDLYEMIKEGNPRRHEHTRVVLEKRRVNSLPPVLHGDIANRIRAGHNVTLKREIEATYRYLRAITSEMIAERPEDRFRNVGQLIPLLEKAQKLAFQLAPYEI